MRKILRLFSDWMLVELEPESRVSSGGILIPGTAWLEPIRLGKVVQAGPGRQYTDKVVPMPDNIIGKRMAFMIFASKTKQGLELRSRLQLDEDYEIIRLGDCLLEVDDDYTGTIRKPT